MLIGSGFVDRALTADEIRNVVAKAGERLQIHGKRVLIIIPDGTRTMPMPLMSEILQQEIAAGAATCDYLVALGTHPLMRDSQLSELLGQPVINGKCGTASVFNHRWDLPETFVEVGVIPTDQVAQISGELLNEPILVRINRLAMDYDQLLI